MTLPILISSTLVGTGAICALAILVKRRACAYGLRILSELLDGCAIDIK